MTAGTPPATLGSDGFYIVADDLTGALDTAGSLASPALPFAVPLGDAATRGPRVAVDTDSRDMTAADAARRVAAAIGALMPGEDALFFKKIDSVMRGHPIAETVAAFRAGAFDRVLFAPAFPDLGRVTRNGRQYVLSAEGARPVGPSLIEAFRSAGLTAVALGDTDHPAIHVANAEDNADLRGAVIRMRALGGRTLYVGSAGLAQALALGSSLPIDVTGLDLAVCGTSHPVTLAQVEKLGSLSLILETLDGGMRRPAAFPAVYAPPGKAGSESAARLLISASLAGLASASPAPRTAFVTGGWTLRTLLQHTRAESLICLGLHLPGVPVSRIVGGRWHDTVIVSKSGGFGDDGLLLKLFSALPSS